MRIRKKSEMIYRMVFIRAWAEHLGIQSQALRELRIQAEKLSRLSWKWDHTFLFRFDSVKKATKMQARNDRQIKLQYQRVLSLVEKVAQEEARRKGLGVLTRTQVREQVYGTSGLVPQAEAYAKEHAIK